MLVSSGLKTGQPLGIFINNLELNVRYFNIHPHDVYVTATMDFDK